MQELFGLSMTTIMQVLFGIFAVSIASVAYIFLRNRVMFNMGLRNLPRRGLQTGLVVIGLMLATLIIAAAFTTGDTIDYSFTARAYDQWQRSDLNLNLRGEHSEDLIGPEIYVPQSAASELNDRFADDPDVEMFVPFLFEKAAAADRRTNLSEPNVNLSGIAPVALDRAGGLRLTDGSRVDLTQLGPTDALVSARAADDLDAQVGDNIALNISGEKFDVVVAGIVKDEQAAGVVGEFDDTNRPGGIVIPIATLQAHTGHTDQVNYISVVLKGGVRSTLDNAESAASRVERYINSVDGREILGLATQHIEVETVKLDDVDQAAEFGNMFTTFFLVIGMFSIAAGIMLIFMIFVMLAAERKPEMGMARAVGAQQGSLVQSFVAEGMSYNLIAGAIGAALGIGAALALIVGYLRFSLGHDFDFVVAHVTLRSLVISYCLGVVLTFITVVIASIKVSSVNIVAAIRGTPEDDTPEQRRISWLALLAGIPAMIVPPLGIWLIFRKGLGVSWTWILAPAGILFGLLFIMMANSGGSEALFSLGFSILPLCVAAIATRLKAPSRVVWTAVGLFLAAYWLSPWNIGEEILGRELDGDIEMFVVSGIMVVVSFTLIIVWNARLLTLLFRGENGNRYHLPVIAGALASVAVLAGVAVGDAWDSLGQLFFLLAGLLALVAAVSFAAVRFPRLGPALKMGVAYPLSNTFRTGMTIAMFSLIIFSLTTFSAVNANFAALLTGEDGDGGWDVVTTTNPGSPVSDLRATLREAGAPVAGEIAATGSVSTFRGQQEVRQAQDDEWTPYPVIAAAASFLSETTVLDSWANGYDSSDAVLSAVAGDPRLAIIDTTAIDGFNRYDWSADVSVENDRFKPFDVSIRDASTGAEHTVTVIGVWASRLTDGYVSGIYINTAAYDDVFGPPEFNRTYVRLTDGVDSEQAARAIESTLAASGVQADSVRSLIDEANAQDRAFTRMFQAFMALGLFVGIAALGVIAFRSVVERRQQIGMLRAIGYQTESITLTFILESMFIAAMGILSGVVGGVIVSRNIFTTGQFSGGGIEFTMPWGEVLVFVLAALAVSLIMTWWPSRSAAQVPVAEALRYE
jgi:putative ABC transport system permease protein